MKSWQSVQKNIFSKHGIPVGYSALQQVWQFTESNNLYDNPRKTRRKLQTFPEFSGTPEVLSVLMLIILSVWPVNALGTHRVTDPHQQYNLVSDRIPSSYWGMS